jgi:aminoglycoside phosphotransferase (APT) family kinase protein
LDLSSLNDAQASLLVQSYAKAMSGHDVEVRPHLVHGDFVPWNMRIFRSGADKRQLCVYDWESGRERGLPLFDAFHFVIQTAVLTGKANAAQTLEQLRKLLIEEESRQYLAAAGIADGTAERLLRMYLLEVILNGIETPGTAHSRLQSGRLELLRKLEAG